MSRDKQTEIEEIARGLCSEIGVAIVIVGLREDGTVNLARSGKYLKNLVDKGYRKSADVVRETVAEAIKVLEEKCLMSVMSNGNYVLDKEDVLFWLRTIPLKMEKKYESEEGK